MAKITLTHSYFLYLDPKQEKIGNAYPPLGTLYAASMLREYGHQISLFDSMLASSPGFLEAVLKKEQPSILVIYDDGFNYLTKMCLTNMREAAFEMISIAKSFGCQVIISSSDSTDNFGLYLKAGADFVILGEGEMTLSELVNALESSTDVALIQGLAYKNGDEIINLGRRPVLRDLDLLPMPAWDLVETEKYKQLWLDKQGYFSLNIATSRGCTYKCNWCAKPIFGNRYHARSPENVLEEAKLLVNTFQASHIWFADDIFGLKPGWITQFADLVEMEKLKLKFKIQSRADLLLDETVVGDLARAGCDEIWIGAESGSQKILDAMDKGITIDQIYKSRHLLKKYQIKAAFFLQFGYPGENKSDIAKTIAMVNELMPDEIGISVSYPLPGTKFYENVKAGLKEKTNWTDSDEMAMMFSHEYPDHYYKDLQVFVHKVYRKQRSWLNLKKILQSPLKADYSQIRSALLFFYYFPLVLLKRGQFMAAE